MKTLGGAMNLVFSYFKSKSFFAGFLGYFGSTISIDK